MGDYRGTSEDLHLGLAIEIVKALVRIDRSLILVA